MSSIDETDTPTQTLKPRQQHGIDHGATAASNAANKANVSVIPKMTSSSANAESSPRKNHAGRDNGDYFALPVRTRGKMLKKFELPLLLLGSLLPAIGVWTYMGRALFTGAFAEMSVALIVSITLSWYVLAQLQDHANSRHLSYVVPVNVMVFAGTLATFALFRIPYSGSYFATGAVFAFIGSFLSAISSAHLAKPHLVVSGGRAAEITFDGQFLPAPSLAEIEGLLKSKWRDWAIVADLHYPHSERTERLFAQAALTGIPVYHFRQIAEMQSGQVKISHLSENELGSLSPNASYITIKRAIDVIGSLVLIPLCFPFFLLLAAIIKMDSAGNVFFIQERMGFRGQTFKMIKFRTMRERGPILEDLGKREDAMTKVDDDRITRIGRFLRKSRMDELPQIFNVLRGDMSLIGPRPEACSLSEWYEAELPFYSYRHIVRPGITGWAQVTQGHVTDVSDVLGKLRYDFYYIKNISMWLDLLIVLKTARVIIHGVGAK